MVAVVLGVASANKLYAQQQTVESIGQTRNPQSSQAELFSNQSGVQNSGDVSTLNSNSSISIPAGQPAADETNSQSTETRSMPLWPFLLGAASLLLIWIALRSSKKQIDSEVMNTEPAKQEEPIKTIKQSKTEPNKPEIKKKKKSKKRVNKQARGKKKR